MLDQVTAANQRASKLMQKVDQVEEELATVLSQAGNKDAEIASLRRQLERSKARAAEQSTRNFAPMEMKDRSMTQTFSANREPDTVS